VKFLTLAILAVFSAWSASVVSVDMATKKIPNARIALGGKLLLAALGALCLNSYIGTLGSAGSYLTAQFYLFWCAHVFWTALAGVVLWYSEIWPAGDAKFFILASAWLPLINPYIRNFPHYLFLNLLVNIFVAAGLMSLGGFIASGLYRVSPADFIGETFRDMKKSFQELLGENGGNKWRLAAYGANMSFLFLLQQLVNAESRNLLGRFLGRTDLLYFFLFFLWDKIGGLFRSKRWLVITTFCYAAYFFAGYFYFYDRMAVLLFRSLVNVFRFSLLLVFGRFMLEFLMEKKDVVFVGPDEIAPGMILSSKSSRTLKGNPVFFGAFDDCFKDGLNVEQAGLLKEWLKKLPVRDPRIEMVTGRPFAVWIFAGAVITLLSGKNIVKLIFG